MVVLLLVNVHLLGLAGKELSGGISNQMTKQDYVLIAAALNSVKPSENDSSVVMKLQWVSCVTAIAHEILKNNPRFNRKIFVDYCERTNQHDTSRNGEAKRWDKWNRAAARAAAKQAEAEAPSK